MRVTTGNTILRGLPLLLGALCLWLLWDKLSVLDPATVWAHLQDVSRWHWLGVAMAILASFFAMALYEVMAHRHLATGLPDSAALRSGATALALGQAVGYGPLVGAAVRARMVPSLPAVTVLRLTGFVTACFTATGLAITLCIALPLLLHRPWLIGLTLPCAICLGAVGLLCKPQLRVFGWHIVMPSLPMAARLSAYCLVDMVAMAAILWLLLPQDVGFAPVFAAFSLALWAGYAGGTPGGIGPFELTLLTLLPTVPPEAVAAACLGYRGVYHLAPALPAGISLLVRCAPPHPPEPRASLPASGPRAEHAIATQTPGFALTAGNMVAPVLLTPQTMLLFLGPLQGDLAPALPALRATASRHLRVPCLYKLSARDAAQARRAGWCVVPFAHDGIVDPQRFSLNGPDRRQLRRHLRQVDRAGITITPLTPRDLPAMAQVHDAWLRQHGRERGLTMGRFCPDYLSDKPVLGAWCDGTLVAFLSCVAGTGGRAVDLMRWTPAAPPGTMQALVVQAISDAAHAGLDTFSLAALPHASLARLDPASAGLARFKTAFAPRWAPLYIAAPNLLGLVVAAADIRRSIHHPPALRHRDAAVWLLDAARDGAAQPQTSPPGNDLRKTG